MTSLDERMRRDAPGTTIHTPGDRVVIWPEGPARLAYIRQVVTDQSRAHNIGMTGRCAQPDCPGPWYLVTLDGESSNHGVCTHEVAWPEPDAELIDELNRRQIEWHEYNGFRSMGHHADKRAEVWARYDGDTAFVHVIRSGRLSDAYVTQPSKVQALVEAHLMVGD